MIGVARRTFLQCMALATGLRAEGSGFASLLWPAPVDGGFAMDGWWVWGGSVIRGDDDKYHMFASRWPGELGFSPHWLTNSEVVRAVSDTPEGPFLFEEVVLEARGEEFWDGRSTHNPTIHRFGDRYLLFYTGMSYPGPTPSPGQPCTEEQRHAARLSQRIGVATATSVRGPWKRTAVPVLRPRPGQWDGLFTTNPAPVIHDDGSVLLLYKSTDKWDGLLRYGAATASGYRGPYRRLIEEPLFDFGESGDHVEDAYLWRSAAGYELLMKDMRGGITGERGAGIHATSPDGARWEISRPAKAYSRTIAFADGSKREFHRAERPQLLIEDGQPRCLYLAVLGEQTGPDTYEFARNVAIPLG